jgi:hypothetical protein
MDPILRTGVVQDMTPHAQQSGAPSDQTETESHLLVTFMPQYYMVQRITVGKTDDKIFPNCLGQNANVP